MAQCMRSTEMAERLKEELSRIKDVCKHMDAEIT